MNRFGGGGGFGKFGGGASAYSAQTSQYGGGGGDASYDAGDFAPDQGGGFQGTQDASPRSPKRAAIVQTLTPVTVRQLLLAQSSPDDLFKVDDRELNQITLVGQIVQLQVQSTNVEMEIDDGTGKMGVRMWVDSTEDQSAPSWTVGSYVRVIGNLRSFMDTRSVLAFRVLPIEPGKYDELTYHMLDVIHVHLSIVRGELDDGSSGTTQSGRQSGYDQSGRPGGAMNRGGGAGAPRGQAAAPAGRFSYCQQSVLEIIRSAGRRNPDGCSFGEVVEALGTQFTEDDIREAVEFLQGEGHLFNTVSDEFFKCAE